MGFQHRGLAAGRWFRLSFVEQMANIGSEVERFLNWRSKNNDAYSVQAFERALELIDLTLEDSRNAKRLKEPARAREAIVDFFLGNMEFAGTEESMRKYFSFFAYAARRNR